MPPENLPAVPGDDDEVLEGTVVDQAAPVPARVARVVVVAVQHPAVQHPARHVSYVPLGVIVVVRRVWDARTTARFERHMRASEAAGDRETTIRWEELRQAYLKDRHRRRMERRESVIHVFRAAPWIAGGSAGVLAAVGGFLAVAERNIAEVAVPFHVVGDVVLWVTIAVSVSWGPLVLAAPWIALGGLWWAGRQYARQLPGGWLAAPADSEDSVMVVTADGIVTALQHMAISELKAAFKDGWRPAFHTTPVRDGEGYAAVFSLPMGVTADMIADKNKVFARNLHRAANEVWPTDAERDKTAPAGYVALWVANPGVLDRSAPEWPLLHSGTADVFKGVPAGVSPRGDAVSIPIVANNFAIGGQMGMGKSNGCRVVMLGAALDPLAELRVHVFAYNGDFDVYGPRLSVYVKGAETPQVAAAMAELQSLYDEVTRREQRISELGAKKITRDMAERHPDLRPILTLFSECHELFGDKQLGEEATDLAVAVIRKARKCAMWMGFDTQDARKDAIPPKLVNLVSVNACFYVKGWQANDGFLGAGAFRAGIRATELRPGRDIGRSLVTGVSDAQFEILKWHYIFSDDDTGADDAAPVIARAMARLAPGTPAAASRTAPAVEARDLLTDLDEVLGRDRVRISDLPALLRDLAPMWTPYRSLTGVQLRELLEAEGVRTTKSGNVPYLHPDDLRRVLREREAEGR